MSLGSLGNNLGGQGNNLYNTQRARMMREAEEQKKRIEAVEAGRLQTELNHLRLSKQTLHGRVTQLEMEMRRERDPMLRRTKETELHKLRNDMLHMEGEIMKMQGREHAAHNIHYNNPHYF
jgi:hypothetical protein